MRDEAPPPSAESLGVANAAALDAWRATDVPTADPVRWHFIEAFARRTAAQEGEARALMDQRLAELLASLGPHLGTHVDTHEVAPKRPPAVAPSPPPRGPLAELVDQLARHAPPHRSAPVAPPAPRAPPVSGKPGAAREPAPSAVAPSELKTLQYFRRTWSRLSADQRLNQSLAQVPENAGPLNSQHLVHRALSLMRDVSPEYLARFVTYVDALMWLDQVNGGPATSGKEASRADGEKKSGRGRAG